MSRSDYRRLASPFLAFLLLFAAISLGRTARDALFLKDVGLSYLPLMYVLNGVFVALGAAVTAWFIDRIDRRVFVTTAFALYAGMCVGLFVLSLLHRPWATTICYIGIQVYFVLGLLQFWTFAGDLFDPREAKRTFPIVASGGLVGQIVAGLGAKPLLHVLSTEQLYLVAAGLLAGSALIVAVSGRREAAADTGLAPSSPGPARATATAAGASTGAAGSSSTWRAGIRHPLVRGLMLLTVLLWIVFTVLDFQFNAVARETFTNKEELAGFFGFFRGCCGGVALLLQFTLTPWLVARLGVGGAIAVHPFFLTSISAVMCAKFGFYTASAAKLGDHVLLYTVQDASYQMLFNAIPSERRGRVRTLIEGTVKPIAIGLAGLLLAGLSLIMVPGQLSYVLLAASAGWLAIALTLKRAYVSALLEALGAAAASGTAASDELQAQLRGPEALAVLEQVIVGQDPARAIGAAEVAVALRLERVRPALERALEAQDAEVRRAACEALITLGSASSVGPLVRLAEADPVPAVRLEALRALGQLGDDRLAERLTPLLQDADPGVASAAIVALIRMGGLDGVLASAAALEAMLRSAQAPGRREAARILGEVRVKHFVTALVRLTRDEDAGVRQQAVRSLGQIGDERAVEALRECLTRSGLGAEAVRALARLGPSAIPALGRALLPAPAAVVTRSKMLRLEEIRQGLKEGAAGAAAAGATEGGTPPIDAEVRSRAARALGALGEPSALPHLAVALEDPDPDLRREVLEAMGRLEPTGVKDATLRQQLGKLARAEVVLAWRMRVTLALLGPAPGAGANGAGTPASLLGLLLADEEEGAIARALGCVGALTGPSAMRGLRARLAASDAASRSLALEAVENLAERGVKDVLLPLLEARAADGLAKARALLPDVDFSERVLLEHLLQHPYLVVRAAISQLLADGTHADLTRAASGLTLETSMSDLLERMLLLRRAPIFAQLKKDDLPHLAALATHQTLEPGAVVFKSGDVGDALFILETGRVAVLAGDGQGPGARRLAELRPPECFGEMAILDGQPRSATVQASEQTTLLVIRRDDFVDLVHERPAIAFGVMAVLTDRLRRRTEHVRAPAEGVGAGAHSSAM